uniref:galactose-specific lectin nattectin-like n=1 Tax=Epinephelus lanceolatus TaxID=310571 RepID=UPI0014450900|nr:galactose-specific lectin nattectin-like [Epinephelus lanceolatus]
MASSLLLIVVLCLTSGLWIGANASCEDHCCKSCPPGWAHFGERCLQFHHTEKTWSHAEHFCTTIGGNLASIHTKADYDYLRNMIFRLTGAHTTTWLGGYDASGEGVWLNSDGSPFTFKDWGTGEPNNSGGKEHCMEINFEGKNVVNDMSCDHKSSFVCARHV